MHTDVPDDLDESNDLGILGLRFLSNKLESDKHGSRTKILSDSGYTVGHLVTHARDFTYGSTIGLHLGQIDQLTFIAIPPKQIQAHFIDCRAGSPSLRQVVRIRFLSSMRRRLVIPAGVAHTFQGIGNVLTRNDLVLYSSKDRDSWRIEDDLISMPVDIPLNEITPVVPNSLLVPMQVALLFYRLQSDLMRGGPLNQQKEILIRAAGISNATKLTGAKIRPSSFFRVADNSWGLLPTTKSCIVHLEILHLSRDRVVWYSHQAHTVIYTFLHCNNGSVELLIKESTESPNHQDPVIQEINFDERLQVCISAGTVYGFKGEGDVLIKLEFEQVTFTTDK